MSKGENKNFLRKKLEKWSEKEWWNNYIDSVIQGDFKEILQTNEPKIVVKIIKWSACKEPIARFSTVLNEIGISTPILLSLLVHNDEDEIILDEISSKKRWKICIEGACNDENEYDELEVVDNVGTSIYFSRTRMKNFIFYIDNADDGIFIKHLQEEISILKCDPINQKKFIDVTVGKSQRITNIHLIEQDKRIREKIAEICDSIPESDIYRYYCKIKEVIKEFYDLTAAEITVSIKNMEISSKNGKLSKYKDNLIEISKDENGWSRKIYSDCEKKVVFENDTIKTSGVSIDKIQETVINANTIIKAIEELEF